MLQIIIDYRLDCVAFALMALVAMWTTHEVLRRRYGAQSSLRVWLLLMFTVAGGVMVTEAAGDHERRRLRQMLEGIAPTYAAELERLNHVKIRLDTPQTDPTYLNLVNTEMRWLKANPIVNDIYTFRKSGEDKIVFIVDSETDYDRDGKIEGEREERTAIGEAYEEVTPNMLRALDGITVFDAHPESDRWGTWVSAYAPIRNEEGDVEAAVGVDYDANYWLSAIAAARAMMLGCISVVAIILVSTTSLVAVSRTELAKRKKLQQQLLEASRQAGMAEIATGVLHNVGNVLNSVNVAASTVTEKLRMSKAPSLSKAIALMKEREADLGRFLTEDDKGKQIPAFLQQVSSFLNVERDAMLDEMALLARSIDHIKEIVTAQQTHAKNGGHEEEFLLSDVVDEAIRLDEASLDRHHVNIEKRYQNRASIKGDRHRVQQIVLNLLSNAKKSVVSANTATGLLIVDIQVIDNPASCIAQLRVIDNGVGIATENLPKVFQHGFTTRSDGHGFGLHSSANNARAMGGSLTAASDGPGKGATFTLTLPALSSIRPFHETPDFNSQSVPQGVNV